MDGRGCVCASVIDKWLIYSTFAIKYYSYRRDVWADKDFFPFEGWRSCRCLHLNTTKKFSHRENYSPWRNETEP